MLYGVWASQTSAELILIQIRPQFQSLCRSRITQADEERERKNPAKTSWSPDWLRLSAGNMFSTQIVLWAQGNYAPSLLSMIKEASCTISSTLNYDFSIFVVLPKSFYVSCLNPRTMVKIKEQESFLVLFQYLLKLIIQCHKWWCSESANVKYL